MPDEEPFGVEHEVACRGFNRGQFQEVTPRICTVRFATDTVLENADDIVVKNTDPESHEASA